MKTSLPVEEQKLWFWTYGRPGSVLWRRRSWTGWGCRARSAGSAPCGGGRTGEAGWRGSRRSPRRRAKGGSGRCRRWRGWTNLQDWTRGKRRNQSLDSHSWSLTRQPEASPRSPDSSGSDPSANPILRGSQWDHVWHRSSISVWSESQRRRWARGHEETRRQGDEEGGGSAGDAAARGAFGGVVYPLDHLQSPAGTIIWTVIKERNADTAVVLPLWVTFRISKVSLLQTADV